MEVLLLPNNNMDLILFGIIHFRKRPVFKKFLLIIQKKAKYVHQIRGNVLYGFCRSLLKTKNDCVIIMVVLQNTKKYYTGKSKR